VKIYPPSWQTIAVGLILSMGSAMYYGIDLRVRELESARVVGEKNDASSLEQRRNLENEVNQLKAVIAQHDAAGAEMRRLVEENHALLMKLSGAK
jgi:hypothetical protein